jgi:hypothetical protein
MKSACTHEGAHTMGKLYETDFCAWTQAQAEALKRGDLSAADLANLIEEIETMGRGQGQARGRCCRPPAGRAYRANESH